MIPLWALILGPVIAIGAATIQGMASENPEHRENAKWFIGILLGTFALLGLFIGVCWLVYAGFGALGDAYRSMYP